MTISIVITADTAEQARHDMRQLLGAGPATSQPKVDVREFVAEIAKNDAGPAQTHSAVATDAVATDFRVTGANIAPTRERGKASPGHTRRTKAEIAEDEAAAQAGAEADVQSRHIDDAAAISTGGERVGPEDDAETVAQDEADETAETAAIVDERPADKKLTLDDVRNALGVYVKLYGMDACQQDGPKVITLVCGEGKVKMSEIPDDQAVLAKVVAGIAEMTAKNPFARTKVA